MMMHSEVVGPLVSLVMSTYNRPDALELCLMSAMAQEYSKLEIIVADDGSKEDTKKLIDAYLKKSSVPIVHVWQPDEGFQLSKIRNKAIATARGNYIISIDADQVLHPLFVGDHVSAARRGSFLQGHRVLLSKDKTDAVIQFKKLDFSFFETGIKNRKNMLHVSVLRDLFSFPHTKIRGVRGSNMSFWKDDLLQVNGFNESFSGWGREDTELVVRLFNLGIKRRDLYFSAIAYHLYHPENSRALLDTNDKILESTIKDRLTRCQSGLSQYI